MKLFYTQSAQQIAKELPFELGKQEIKKFSDGELLVKVDPNIKNQEVWLIASTQSPAENLIECYFMLDALARNGANINLIITYFGYERQDKTKPGEALSTQVVSAFFNTFPINKFFIVHPHSHYLPQYLQFTPIFPTEIYTQLIKKLNITIIAAPDKGAEELCSNVATANNGKLIRISKTRPDYEVVKLSLSDPVPSNSNILIIDDLISTGNTVIQAAQLLHDTGAQNIYGMATHGLFTNDACKRIEKSYIQKLFVTNTIPQPESNSVINAISIAPHLEKIIVQNTQD